RGTRTGSLTILPLRFFFDFFFRAEDGIRCLYVTGVQTCALPIWIFWLNVPIGIALIPLALTRLNESHGPSSKLDLPGLALASGEIGRASCGKERRSWRSSSDRIKVRIRRSEC